MNFRDNISYDLERQPEYKWCIIDETKMSSKILHKYSRVNIFTVQLTRSDAIDKAGSRSMKRKRYRQVISCFQISIHQFIQISRIET